MKIPSIISRKPWQWNNYALLKIVASFVLLGLVDQELHTKSISYLSSLPISMPKIDRTNIANIDRKDNRSLISAILNLDHQLDKKIIAEGIERTEQLEFLREVNCD